MLPWLRVMSAVVHTGSSDAKICVRNGAQFALPLGADHTRCRERRDADCLR